MITGGEAAIILLGLSVIVPVVLVIIHFLIKKTR